MKIIIPFIVALGIAGAWLYLNAGRGSSGENLKPYIKNVPFAAFSPAYLPSGFSLDKTATAGLNQGTNIGIPQFNLVYKDAARTSSIAFRQFDRGRFKQDILDGQKLGSFEDYFTGSAKAVLVSRSGLDLYIYVAAAKAKTVFGDSAFTAAGFLLKDDSLIQVNYSGETKFSEETLVQILLSLKKI